MTQEELKNVITEYLDSENKIETFKAFCENNRLSLPEVDKALNEFILKEPLSA